MRKEFAKGIIDNFSSFPNQVFITGDLGFMALEEVRTAFADRFLNGGVAEQNMVSIAAALAYDGFIPWVYSISPFVTLRPYEQLRNDVCLHNFPVKVVGNGGGYGYGIMGATHHNNEDIGSMRILPNMKVLVPLIASDVNEAIIWMLNNKNPNYLRLNLAATFEEEIAPFAAWRKIKSGTGAVVIGTGPILNNLRSLPNDIYQALEIWAVSIFPIEEIPTALTDAIRQNKKLVTIEEHNGNGGLNEAIAPFILKQGLSSIQFINLFSKGYPSGKYGDQSWHQEESGLKGEPLLKTFQDLLK
jgi:transketolase